MRSPLRTTTVDLVSSFVSANEMLVNSILGIDILLDASDEGAVFDSKHHYDRRCFPGTREQYIADITKWVTESSDPPSSIYWIRGPAGVGKSAIAQTCAEKLKKSGNLGAAFFFNVNKHSDPSRLFTSIAYQLTTALPDYRAAVDEKISKDKSLVGKKLVSQFRSLIVEPLKEVEKHGKRIQAKAILIDGLDECGKGCASRNYRNNRILRQGRVHSISLGYLQPRWTSHCIHIQAGQHYFCHSFCWAAYLSQGRRWDRDVSSWWIQKHTWTAKFPTTTVIMAIWQRHPDPCWCGGWPICTPNCCVASCGLPTRPAIPWKTSICSRRPGWCEETGVHITLFATWRPLCVHHGADSRKHSSVCTIVSFLWFGWLERRLSLVCCHALLHI